MVYRSSAEKAEDNHSSGILLVTVGAIGLIGDAFFLMKNPLDMPLFNRYLSCGIMGALFILFFVMGLLSVRTYKIFTIKAKEENNILDQVRSWCDKELTKEVIEEEIKFSEESEFDYEYSKDKERLLFKGNSAALLVVPESEDEFPELAATLKAEAEETASEYEKERNDYIESATEQYEDDPEFFEYGSYDNSSSVMLRRLDDTVLSYAKGCSSFMGGAHGYYSETGNTYDVKTGKKLKLTDVLTDTAGLDEVLKEKLLEKYDAEDFFDLDDSFTHYDPELDSYKESENGEDYSYAYEWTLTPLGIQFYFAPYELGAYATGSHEVVLGYEEYPKAFVEEYVPKEYGSFIYDFRGEIRDFDLTGDGEPDTLSIDFDHNDDYTEIIGISASVNGNEDSFNDDLWITSSDYISHYIRLSDGRQYVYVNVVIAEEYNEYFVFEIDGGAVKAVDSTTLDNASGIFGQNGRTYSYAILADPENMQLEQMFWILSTFYGVRSYHVGADGMPESDEPYRINSVVEKNTIVSTTDLVCDIVDEDGNVLSTGETIGSGASFYLLATDGESYVDARISDGRIVRINITSTEHPCYVDGVPADECFEELFYVG